MKIDTAMAFPTTQEDVISALNGLNGEARENVAYQLGYAICALPRELTREAHYQMQAFRFPSDIVVDHEFNEAQAAGYRACLDDQAKGIML